MGDVNGDNKPDIVIGSSSSPDGRSGGKMSVFLGNGDGTFQPERVALTGLGLPFSLVLADLNGDGNADLAFIDSGVKVALGSGGGNFTTPVAYADSLAESLAAGDINGDGIPDIVTNTASIWLGDGKGGFSNSRNYATETDGQVILTDFNGDGLTDIVIADGNASVLTGGTITVLFGRGGGTFFAPPVSSAPTFPVADADLTGLRAADFNNDGIPDLVVADNFGNINVLEGLGDGFFRPVFAHTFPSPAQIPWNVVTADFNHDGNVDFAVVQTDYVVSGSGSVQVFLGKGDGTFQAPLEIPAPLGAFSLAVADFNGDGKPDLAVLVSQQAAAIEGLTSAPDGSILIFLGNGDGTFTSHGSYTVEPGAQAIIAGNFNGDGTPDLAVLSVSTGAPNQNGDVLLLTGKGDGTFTAGTDVPLTGAPGTNFVSLAAADFNRDGRLDLAAAISDGEPGSGELVILLGRGDGTFHPPVPYATGVLYVTVGDLNGDRIPDLIVTGQSVTGYFLGNGDGTFQPESAFFGLSGNFITLDLHGDGRVNIAGFSEGEFTGIATLLNISQPARRRRPR